MPVNRPFQRRTGWLAEMDDLLARLWILGRPLVDLMTREVTVNGLGATGDRLGDEHYAIGWGKPGPTSAASLSSLARLTQNFSPARSVRASCIPTVRNNPW